MSTVTERVAAGAAFLDEHDPEWWRTDVERAIDLAKLDIVETDMCVLGQRCPLGTAGMALTPFALQAVRLTGNEVLGVSARALWEWAVKLGFSVDCEPESYLTAEWKRVITERRAAS